MEKYQGQVYDAAIKPLLVITEERILIDTGIGELPDEYRGILHHKRVTVVI